MVSLQVGKLRPGEVLDAKVRFVGQAAKVACRLLAGLTMTPLVLVLLNSTTVAHFFLHKHEYCHYLLVTASQHKYLYCLFLKYIIKCIDIQYYFH